MTAVNWLTSQSWPVFLAIWLPFLLVILAVLLVVVAAWPLHLPPEPTRRKVSGWHMHECGCLCAGGLIYPCPGHKGHAAAVLHQETK